MQTAMANGKEPYAWMRYVMEQLPTCESAEQIEQLLPLELRTADLPLTTIAPRTVRKRWGLWSAYQLKIAE